MTFGSHHAALVAEYQSLMDEEQTLWSVISPHFMAGDAESHSPLDLLRWTQVRQRRAELDRAIDAVAVPRESAWGELAADRI